MIKPEFFQHEGLAELNFEARLGFIGLWTLADREGRLEDRPKRIRASLFPYEDVDIEAMLSALESAGFIVRYSAEGKQVIAIPSFLKHQNPHNREAASDLPEPQKRTKARPSTGRGRAKVGADHDQGDDEPGGVGVGVGVGNAQVGFHEFWEIYPRRVAKLDAERAWNKIPDDEQPAVLAGVLRARQSEAWRSDGGKFVPYPATWLNGRRWEDDIAPVVEVASPYAGTKEWLACTNCGAEYCRIVGQPDEHRCQGAA